MSVVLIIKVFRRIRQVIKTVVAAHSNWNAWPAVQAHTQATITMLRANSSRVCGSTSWCVWCNLGVINVVVICIRIGVQQSWPYSCMLVQQPRKLATPQIRARWRYIQQHGGVILTLIDVNSLCSFSGPGPVLQPSPSGIEWEYLL